MNIQTPGIGHNRPDPIDEAVAPYDAAITEAQNWLDGEPVTDEAQMYAVDAILKDIRKAGTDLGKAKKAAIDPLHKAWKAEGDRWKPTEDDIARIKTGLAALVDPFKRKLAAEKEAIKRAAYDEARRLEREAEEAASKANAANIEEQRAADHLRNVAMEAKKAASEANKDTVKGLRTVTHQKVTDYSKMLLWMNKNQRAALEALCDDYARRHYNEGPIPGVEVWKTKEAF